MGRIPNALKEKALKGLKSNGAPDETPPNPTVPLSSSSQALELGHHYSRKSKLRSNDSDSENEVSSEESSERSLECPSSKKLRTEEPQASGSLWSNKSRPGSINQFTNMFMGNPAPPTARPDLEPKSQNPSLGHSSYLSMLYAMAKKSHEAEPVRSPSASLNNDNRTFLTNLLRMHPAFFNSNLTARMFQSSLVYSLADGLNETTYKMMSSILNDKIYQHMSEQLALNKLNYERAKSRSNEREEEEVDEDEDDEAEPSAEKVWSSLIETLPSVVERMVSFARELQGLSDLAPADFSAIVNSRLFDYFVVVNADLLVDDESYITLKDGVQYKREFMEKISGKPKVDAIFDFANAFNRLDLTVKEKALFLAIVLTIPDSSMRDLQLLKSLNEHYTKTLLHEFEVSKRNETFILELSKVSCGGKSKR